MRSQRDPRNEREARAATWRRRSWHLPRPARPLSGLAHQALGRLFRLVLAALLLALAFAEIEARR